MAFNTLVDLNELAGETPILFFNSGALFVHKDYEGRHGASGGRLGPAPAVILCHRTPEGGPQFACTLPSEI